MGKTADAIKDQSGEGSMKIKITLEPKQTVIVESKEVGKVVLCAHGEQPTAFSLTIEENCRATIQSEVTFPNEDAMITMAICNSNRV